MKAKILAAIVAMLMVAVMAMPAIGQDPGANVPTSAEINGGDIAPEVQYSWELPDDDLTTPGTQVEPVPDGTKEVDKYVVVYHSVSADKIGSVKVETYYPGDTPGVDDPKEWSWATQVIEPEIQDAINAALAAGLITQAEADDINYKISCNWAAMYKEVNVMSNCDIPGIYQIVIKACATGGACSANHLQEFEYLSGIGFTIDFAAVDYGLIIPCVYKEICGDLDMTTADKPTIENTCNDPIELCVSATDMHGVVNDPDNVITADCLDAKLDGETIPTLSTTPQCFNLCIDPCSVQCMGFSIHAPTGTCEDAYSGTITLEIHHCP